MRSEGYLSFSQHYVFYGAEVRNKKQNIESTKPETETGSGGNRRHHDIVLIAVAAKDIRKSLTSIYIPQIYQKEAHLSVIVKESTKKMSDYKEETKRILQSIQTARDNQVV